MADMRAAIHRIYLQTRFDLRSSGMWFLALPTVMLACTAYLLLCVYISGMPGDMYLNGMEQYVISTVFAMPGIALASRSFGADGCILYAALPVRSVYYEVVRPIRIWIVSLLALPVYYLPLYLTVGRSNMAYHIMWVCASGLFFISFGGLACMLAGSDELASAAVLAYTLLQIATRGELLPMCNVYLFEMTYIGTDALTRHIVICVLLSAINMSLSVLAQHRRVKNM